MMKKLSNLQQRLLSSLILIPVVLAVLWVGGWVLGVAASVVIAISFAEWMNLIQKTTPSLRGRILGGLLGIVYLGIAFCSFLYLRLFVPDGTEFLVYLMLLVWASDSGAYLFGKTIGGPKMSPTISPKKTWAGYGGALLGPACCLVVCIHFLTPAVLIEYTPPALLTFVVGGLLGIVGQSGDLMISALKRKAQVKDTGAIVPGHGGMLDRIDALLLIVLPYLCFVLYILPS